MGEMVVSCKCARVPGLSARIVIAEATIRHRRNHPAAIVTHALIFLAIHVVRHGTVSIELTRRLPVEGLRLMTMGSWRARGSGVIVHFVVEVLIIHDMLKLPATGRGAWIVIVTRQLPVLPVRVVSAQSKHSRPRRSTANEARE